jgi:hypothetical protein
MLELYGNKAYSLPWQYNAGEYWYHVGEGWARSDKPILGSIGCYADTTGSWGHVLVVEQVNSDGSIVTSESAWQGTRWYSQTLRPPYYTWNSVFKLQGFIYNPDASTSYTSKIEDFIKTAKDSINKKPSDIGLKNGTSCSAKFVVYCAKQVQGVLGTVIPNKSIPSEFANAGSTKDMGKFLVGPAYGRPFVPRVGDIMLARVSQTRKYEAETDCDELYIVTDVGNSIVYVVGVPVSGNKIIRTEFKDTSKLIAGYYRPDWMLLNNSVLGMMGYTPLGKFYDTENTSEDATIREVAYIGSDTQPTTSTSSIKLSVVNYTTMLSSVMDGLLVPSVYSGSLGGDVILDGVDNQKARECIQFFVGKGLNSAAACGICGNIQGESNFNTAAVGDYGTSFGICQWHYGRGDNMKRMAGSNWQNNLTGQLEYLWSELQSGYSVSTLQPIQNVPNTEQGARQAADIFVRKFEIPADPDGESVKRQQYAVAFFNQVVTQMTTTQTSKSSVVSSNKPFSGEVISIPTTYRQNGIDTTYTNYTYFYNQWGKSTNQRKVANLWNAKGRKSNRNIATIDGLYLVALKTTFGVSGDRVSIILEDGTIINCLIADSKGWENGKTGAALYGHTGFGGGLNVVEWECIGPANSNISNTPPNISGWKGKSVIRIVKGGSIL